MRELKVAVSFPLCVVESPFPSRGDEKYDMKRNQKYDIQFSHLHLRPFFGRDVAGISRSSCREFTNDECCKPLLEPYVQATNARFPTFAPNSHISAQKSSNIHAIYHHRRDSQDAGAGGNRICS